MRRVNGSLRRRDAKSVPVLGALISSSDPGMAEAASAALAKIGDQPALVFEKVEKLAESRNF